MGEGGGGGGEPELSQEVMEEERKHFKKIANSFLYYKLVGTVDTTVSDRAETKGGCLYQMFTDINTGRLPCITCVLLECKPQYRDSLPRDRLEQFVNY